VKAIHVLAVAVLAVALSAGAARSADHQRGGFFIGFNLGAGTAGISSDLGDTEREWGGAANFRLGAAIKSDLLLGADFSAWAKEEDGTTVTLSTYLVAVTYYPGDEGFFLRGGIGFGSTSFEVDFGGGLTQTKDESGFALAGAAGYEWRLTRKFALGPQVEFTYLNIGGDLIDTANYFNGTLGFNWYW
jgi:hypothetical protein